jgi:hypothetical protein
MHAFLQATGWIIEHQWDCFKHPRHLKDSVE